VEQGGATVFTTAHGHLKPKKGSAVFWYNLYASGEGETIIYFSLVFSLFDILFQEIIQLVMQVDFYCFLLKSLCIPFFVSLSGIDWK